MTAAIVGKPAVLIVDDEPAVLRLLRAMLERLGEYELFEAADGHEAKRVLALHSIDVVVTDLVMPGLGGLDLMQWALEHCPRPQWIVLSGQASLDSAIHAVRLGAFDFLCKPIETAEVLRLAVRNAARHGRMLAEGERMSEELRQQNERLKRQLKHLIDAYEILRQQAATITDDLQRAEHIQRALLPALPPRLAPFAVDAVYRVSHRIGGDIYDVLPLDNRRVALYVADAAGHGVSAAMLSVLFKNRLVVRDGRGEPLPPAQVLERVNQTLAADCAAPAMFLTAAYCLLDTVTGELTLASAGHLPLLLRRADGSSEELPQTGPALGIARDSRYTQRMVSLRAGDRLLLYTDGLLAGASAGGRLDAGQLLERLGAAPTGAQALTDLLEAARARRNGVEPGDDITLLLLEAQDRPSTIDNGLESPPADLTGELDAARPHGQVLVGEANGARCFAIRGEADWTHCTAFHDQVARALQAGRAIEIDLSACQHLDSTFLGTILEAVDLADQTETAVNVRGMTSPLRALFDELGMSRVLVHLAAGTATPPSAMTPLETCDEGDDRKEGNRILSAHKALANLGARNRAQFAGLIAMLESEMQRA
ncbi:MAG: SpoIIE family protein phosphatase [Planctomycetota bacterium]|nr:SpoIIE family protein phosphatase [Planctomycetota bacterium]